MPVELTMEAFHSELQRVALDGDREAKDRLLELNTLRERGGAEEWVALADTYILDVELEIAGGGVLREGFEERLHPRGRAGKFVEKFDGVDVGDDVNRAADLLAQGKKVRLRHTRDATVLLDELAKRSLEARKLGEKAPTYNLCEVTVKNTNLFCAESKGIPRIKMPQLKANDPIPGSRADRLPRDKRGEVDLGPQFRRMLQEHGIAVTDGVEPADRLRPSQIELNGAKVAGIMQALESGVKMDGRLFVSRDNYIVDGHHRWASEVGLDAQDGKLGDVNMNVSRIDMPIIELLGEANKFAKDWGIPQAGLADNFADPAGGQHQAEKIPDATLYHVAPRSADPDIEKHGLRPRVEGEQGTFPEFPIIPGVVYVYSDRQAAERWAKALDTRDDVIYRLKGIPDERLMPDHEELDDDLNQHFNFSSPSYSRLRDALDGIVVDGESLTTWWRKRVPRSDHGGKRSVAAVAEMPAAARIAAAKALRQSGQRLAVLGTIGPEHLEVEGGDGGTV